MEKGGIEILWRFYIDDNLINEVNSNSKYIISRKEEIKKGEGHIRASKEILTPDVIIKIVGTAVLVGAGKKAGEDIWQELKNIIPTIVEALKNEIGYISKKFKKDKLNLVELNATLTNGLIIKFLFSDVDEEQHLETMIDKAKEFINSEKIKMINSNFGKLESHIRSQFMNFQLVWDKEDKEWKELDLSKYITNGKFIYP